MPEERGLWISKSAPRGLWRKEYNVSIVIQLQRVTKIYCGRPVVNDLSLSVKRGSVFGFLGENGAGKTTTIKMIVGLIRPDKGAITIGGSPVDDVLVRARIGFMPESPYFYERLTGIEFLRFCGELFPGNKKRDTDYFEILRRVDIYDVRNAAIRTYSKGMKQRLGFAQALVNDPDYILLDEPLDGLDPVGRKEVKDIIRSLHGEGKTVFFNSHILYDTEELCDEIGVIHEGRLLYSGPLAGFSRGMSLEDRFVETVEARRKAHAL